MGTSLPPHNGWFVAKNLMEKVNGKGGDPPGVRVPPPPLTKGLRDWGFGTLPLFTLLKP